MPLGRTCRLARFSTIHRSMARIYFIAVKQQTREEWSVIELNQENAQIIIKGLPARQSRLLRDQVSCMSSV